MIPLALLSILKTARPFLPYIIGAVAAASALWYAHHLGYESAEAKWKAKEQDRIIYAAAQSIARYRAASEASDRQRAQEAEAALERENILKARAAELEAESADREKAAADLEVDLRAAITDKGKADALIAKMRTARDDCRATDRDIAVDQRMRRNQKPVGR